MMQRSLSLQTLGELDGGAARLIIDAAIAEFSADLDDRGDDRKPRKVEITITGQQMDNGLTEIHVEAAARLPKRRTNSTVAKTKSDPNRRARLLFQDGAPDDPHQRTIDETAPGEFHPNEE